MAFVVFSLVTCWLLDAVSIVHRLTVSSSFPQKRQILKGGIGGSEGGTCLAKRPRENMLEDGKIFRVKTAGMSI